MAFTPASFQPIGGQSRNGSAPSIFSYKTTDAATVVRVVDYFLPIAALLEIGDLIYVVVTSSGALSTAGWVVVKDKSTTSIDVTDATALTVTDTD